MVRRNLAFLYSVDPTRLTGDGFAFSLTLRDCPETAEEWQRLRNVHEMRLRRAGGFLRLHWAAEWQARRCPHLHGSVYFDTELWDRRGDPIAAVKDHWVDVARQYGPRIVSQDCKAIWDPVAWAQYVAKHAARGQANYQRSAAARPRGWTDKTGRMWGRSRGDSWPTMASKVEIDAAGFYRLRRICRGWRQADARAEGSPWRIRSARRMLQAPTREASSVRGVSEWMNDGVTLAALAFLSREGHEIESV